MNYVFLDHNSGSPLRDQVRRAMAEVLQGSYGNPSSVHRPGHRAKLLLERARQTCADLVGASPDEVVFTSGGTEANNLAVMGTLRARGSGHVITSQIEHSSVLSPVAAMERDGFAVSRIRPDAEGRIDPDRILDELRADTVLVSLMHSSNELGTLQPVAEVAEGLRGRDILLHTDAVQSAGKVPIRARSLGVDLISVSGHKMGGPPGTGFLWIREGVSLTPILLGGGQETNRRAGTEALPLIHGFAAAARLSLEEAENAASILGPLRDRLEEELKNRLQGVRFHGASRPRLPNTTSVAIPGTRGEDMMMALDLEGFAVSTGSACAIGTIRPSHVLKAIGCSSLEAEATLRISLGPQNREQDVVRFVAAVSRIHERTPRRMMSGAPVSNQGPGVIQRP